jgi:hypothetical protein
MPAANRGKQLRRLSPVTLYAALSELPRGALKIKTRRTERQQDSCCSKPATLLLIV